MPLGALIFDFDGMVLDTETPDFTVLAEQYRAHGCELLAERWLRGLGTHGAYEPYAELEELLGRALDRAWVEGWLTRHALRDRFRCVRTRDDVARVKPAPDLFLAAAACLGVPPEACVVLEDSPNGMRAAAAAGMRCVAVTIDLLAQLELPPHTLRLRSLAEVEPRALLARLREEA
jgi:beta-phosphoglucomutase-like phosphatase (HAD superfamily)